MGNQKHTTETLRKTLLDTIQDVLSGSCDVKKANAVANLAKTAIQTAELEIKHAATRALLGNKLKNQNGSELKAITLSGAEIESPVIEEEQSPPQSNIQSISVIGVPADSNKYSKLSGFYESVHRMTVRIILEHDENLQFAPLVNTIARLLKRDSTKVSETVIKLVDMQALEVIE